MTQESVRPKPNGDFGSVVAPGPAGAQAKGAASEGGPLDDPALKEVLKQSSTLRKDIEELQKDKFTVRWGAAGGGTYIDENKKQIVVDANSKGNGADIAQSLAHEVGHKQFSEPQDRSSKEAWVNVLLRDEAAATIKNARVRKEILDKGGADIGFPGQHADKYKSITDEMLAGKITEEDALKKIADVFKTEVPSVKVDGKTVTYEEYYGASYPGPATRTKSPAPHEPGPEQGDRVTRGVQALGLGMLDTQEKVEQVVVALQIGGRRDNVEINHVFASRDGATVFGTDRHPEQAAGLPFGRTSVDVAEALARDLPAGRMELASLERIREQEHLQVQQRTQPGLALG